MATYLQKHLSSSEMQPDMFMGLWHIDAPIFASKQVGWGGVCKGVSLRTITKNYCRRPVGGMGPRASICNFTFGMMFGAEKMKTAPTLGEWETPQPYIILPVTPAKGTCSHRL